MARPVESLRPDPTSARVHGERNLEAIAASLRRFGQQRPILTGPGGLVIAGNAVLAAARTLGWSHLAALRSDLRGAALRGYGIADNRTAELAGWDEGRLAQQLKELAAAQIGLEDLGFRLDEVADLLAAEEPEGTEVPAAPQRAAKLRSRRGRLYRLGGHRLLCGDSRVAASYQRLLRDQRAALAVTSPPYGVGKAYEQAGIAPWFQTVRPVIRELCRRADVVVWNIGDLYATGGPFIEPTFAYSVEMFRRQGYRPLWVRIWLKPGMNFGVSPYHLASTKPVQQYEYVGAFGTDEGGAVVAREEFDVTDFEWIVALAGAKYRYVRRLDGRQRRQWGYAGVWRMNPVAANAEHPAMFPLELPLRAILMHSDPGATVLEPFCGSGTTILAAERTGRQCVAIELDPSYCDLARRRWAQLVHGEGCDWIALTPAD